MEKNTRPSICISCKKDVDIEKLIQHNIEKNTRWTECPNCSDILCIRYKDELDENFMEKIFQK
jgi:DNA-directed RNA polymerase subunit RPC12/RpoP